MAEDKEPKLAREDSLPSLTLPQDEVEGVRHGLREGLVFLVTLCSSTDGGLITLFDLEAGGGKEPCTSNCSGEAKFPATAT